MDVDEPIAERSVAIDRVIGWHIRTVLGDALWRTEAGIALQEVAHPDNGSTSSNSA